MKPADWGIGMTLCIAAISRPRAPHSSIVAVSDLMLSSEIDSFDTQTLKCGPISKNGKWIAMYAGDPSVWEPVRTLAKGAIEGGSETVQEVESAFESAFQTVLKHKIEGEILGRYGLSREQFITNGLAHFGEHIFGKLLDLVSNAALETSFIVAGFDSAGPHIFSVDDPGVCTRHTAVGFCAIGTGSVLATSALCHSYDVTSGAVSVVYRICEAKFRGEQAPGVGKKTFVDVMAPDGKHRLLLPEHIDDLREIWRSVEPPIPDTARNFIERHLDKIGWPYGPPPKDGDATT